MFNQLDTIGKDSDAGRDWGQEQKGTTEDEMLDGLTDSMDVSLSELREFTQTHVHRISDAIQPS